MVSPAPVTPSATVSAIESSDLMRSIRGTGAINSTISSPVGSTKIPAVGVPVPVATLVISAPASISAWVTV